ncbi:hypothetical protein BX666DRAFT_478726 [Dichotomocladium elegans]|nr:hypothetical protein BX666DRAFT_478726 [Dichotomocladium elegans]
MPRSVKMVEKNGYYTISHMWGEPKTWVPWTSHGMVGADGKQLSVQMRLEKQQTFMRLFREYPGYWWIDVFCARNDTQLYMMGDVYRFCKKCFALLDFPESGFQKVQTVSKHLQSLESFTGVIDSYKQRIDGKSGSADQSWSDTLTDLMGGWYEGSQDDIAALATFFDCKWFTRVWTLQEYLLPQTLFFMSECDTKNTMLDRSVIEEITDDLGSVVGAVLNSYIDQKFGTHPRIGYLGFSKDQHAYAANAQGVSRCYFDMSRIATFEIVAHFVSIFHNQHGCNLMDLRHVSLSVDPLVLILVHFASLPRTCLFPCDYIYGVAGLLVPEQFDLSEAKDMHDVYNIFLGEDIVNQLDRIDNILGTTELIEAYAD